MLVLTIMPMMICKLKHLIFSWQQVTDYAIARRIVDLHARNKESFERIYSVEDMQRYLMFARQFKPKVQTHGLV